MDNVLMLFEKLNDLFFGLSGLYLALRDRAQFIGWPKAIRGSFTGIMGCYLVAAVVIFAGQLVQLARKIELAPPPAVGLARPLVVPPMQPAQPVPPILEGTSNLALFAWALLFAPFLWIIVRETFPSTLNTSRKPRVCPSDRFAKVIECDGNEPIDRAVVLAFFTLRVGIIVVPGLLFAENVIRWLL
jgi:hypothetical protein